MRTGILVAGTVAEIYRLSVYSVPKFPVQFYVAKLCNTTVVSLSVRLYCVYFAVFLTPIAEMLYLLHRAIEK